MKQFAMRYESVMGFTTVAILTQVCNNPGADVGGMDISQIRERCKILDAIEEAAKLNAPAVSMDDKLHEALKKLLAGFKFGTAHRDLLQVVDDVLEAESVKDESKAKAN